MWGVAEQQGLARVKRLLDKAGEDFRAQQAVQQETWTNALNSDLVSVERLRVLEIELVKLKGDLDNANARIETLTARDEDATGSIEALRIKIQESQERIEELEDQNDDLERRQAEAEEAYDLQIKLAASAMERRRNPIARIKHERDGSCDETSDSSGRKPKRPRNIITTREDGAIDLTCDERVGTSA
jgi:chromosome segregation ATPase